MGKLQPLSIIEGQDWPERLGRSQHIEGEG